MIEQAPSSAKRIVELNLDPEIGFDLAPAARDDGGPPAAPRLVRRLGAGRSAVVSLMENGEGAPFARKLFEGDPLAKLVHLIATGAPNPYQWNEHAIAAAVGRRRILEALVRVWFGERLRLPALLGAGWDEQARAMYLDMEVIRGRAPALHHAHATGREGELHELVTEVMQPLQGRLRDAGFDGLLWQAGLGNPVASSNFLLEQRNGVARTVWIDLESGVPALFPLDPLALLRFYVPRSFAYRCALFDDVDVAKLRGYLETNRVAIADGLDPHAPDVLLAEADVLERHQRAWKKLGRFRSSLTWAHRRGHITDAQAAHYAARPVRWYARLFARGLLRLPRASAKLIAKAYRKFVPHSPLTIAKMALKFLFSQRWRTRWAAHVIRTRIRAWERRQQLDGARAQYLIAHVRSEEATAYLTDFGIHIAIKAPVKAIEWGLLPALFAAGLIGHTTLLVGLAIGGMAGRTLYTSWRLVQATARGRERPWIAFVVGLLPVVGNAAYPVQILYTSAERDHDVAKFILVDLFTALGRALPIWGGADTRTEHFFNRLPIWYVRSR